MTAEIVVLLTGHRPNLLESSHPTSDPIEDIALDEIIVLGFRDPIVRSALCRSQVGDLSVLRVQDRDVRRFPVLNHQTIELLVLLGDKTT